MGASTVFAQPDAQPQFDVASIKPSVSQRMANVRPLSGRFAADAPLQILIAYAYGVQPFQVVGGPGWLASDRYQIDAKSDANVTRAQMSLMVQSLLEERFGLKTHPDSKEQTVFALVPSRNGLKLPLPKQDTCTDSPGDAASEWTGTGRITAPGEGEAAKPRCGSAEVSLRGGAQIKGGKIAMPELARVLSTLVGRGVIDKTEYKEVFDIQLQFVPDDMTPSMPPPPPNSGIEGESIARALQQQLGLRLETTKGQVQVIVVDRAQRPSAN
jgi:uncharacterized protein (TIGR03435 family)